MHICYVFAGVSKDILLTRDRRNLMITFSGILELPMPYPGSFAERHQIVRKGGRVLFGCCESELTEKVF